MNGSFKLVMHQGPWPGQTFVLNQDLTILGRDASSSIAIDVPAVSRQHARIIRYGERFVIEDLRSANGTFVNGILLTAPHALVHGDTISLGGAVTFTCVDPSMSLPYPAPPQPQYAPPPYQAPPPPRYAPPPVARPRRRRRPCSCWIVVLAFICLCGSLIAVGGWFYGAQVIAWLQKML